MKSLTNAIAVSLLVLAAAQASAQEPYVKIREPVEWRDGKSFVVAAGRAVKISGVAWHPAGIKQVLVNGVMASLDPDPPLTNFEHVITADSVPRTINITILPESSTRFETQFAMSPPEVPLVRRSVDPVPVAPTHSGSLIATKPAVDSTLPPPLPGIKPWGGFKKRGMLYLGGAVAGGVLGSMTSTSTSEVCSGGDCVDRTEATASYKSIGLAMIGASLAAGLYDFMKTSGGTRMSSNTSSRADSRFTKYLDGSAYVTRESVGWNLIHIQF